MARVEEIKKGTTVTFRLTAKANGVPIDITGYTSSSLKIAKSLNISNANATYYELVLAVNFSDGVNGIHDFVVAEDDSKEFNVGLEKSEIRLIDSSNTISDSNIIDVDIVETLHEDEA